MIKQRNLTCCKNTTQAVRRPGRTQAAVPNEGRCPHHRTVLQAYGPFSRRATPRRFCLIVSPLTLSSKSQFLHAQFVDGLSALIHLWNHSFWSLSVRCCLQCHCLSFWSLFCLVWLSSSIQPFFFSFFFWALFLISPSFWSLSLFGRLFLVSGFG